MKVREVMSKDFVYLSPDDTVSKFISTIHDKRLHEVPLLDNKKIVGVVYDSDLAKKRFINPNKEKLKTLMTTACRTISPEQSIEEAADWIFKTGCEGLPVVEENKVIGVVTIYDLMLPVSKSKEFRQTVVESIMSIPEVVNIDTDVGAVKTLMRERHYERVPVVDLKGNLAGSVDIFDLGKATTTRERISWYSMAPEKEQVMKIPVSAIMNTDVVTSEKSSTLTDIANIMERNNTSEVIIIQNNLPVGIVTAKDLLEVFISGMKTKGVYYQIVGLTDEDEFVVSTAQRMIEDTLKKISNMYKVEFLFVHVKKHQGHRGRTKYSIRTRIRTGKGTFVSKAYEWDLRDAIHSAMDKLGKEMFKRRSEKRQRRRKMQTEMKEMFK
jgi:CBS domain-containing protein